MTSYEAEKALRAAGYTWREAWDIIEAIRQERAVPLSRSKKNRLHRAEQALREIGVAPTLIEFHPGSYGSTEWIYQRRGPKGTSE
jgi:hypothetical protein